MFALKKPFFGDRLPYETEWSGLYDFLLQSGYELRARYHPDWTPSWAQQPKFLNPFDHEDAVHSWCKNILDATRREDGACVILKLIFDKDPSEEHGRFFLEGPRRLDPRNHSAPLLDVLHPPTRPGTKILVYYRYIPWDIWPFCQVSEVVDLLSQAIEGLAFMHQNNVAHLDCSYSNLVMDGLHLFEEPNHPSKPYRSLKEPRPARHIERYQSATPVRYYYIDFELSVQFGPDNPQHLCRREKGQDNTAPELLSPAPYNAFALDVYCLGHMILIYFLNGYTNLEFLRPFVYDMIRDDPVARPTARELNKRFAVLKAGLSPRQLRKSPGPIDRFDATEYLMGEVPARVPRSLSASFLRLFGIRKIRPRRLPRRNWADILLHKA